MTHEPEEQHDVKIEFTTSVLGLNKIEECLPKPAKNFIPDWWKLIPSYSKLNNMQESVVAQNTTARQCPSFVDYFSQGYIVPMWADTTLKYNEVSKEWNWRCGSQDSKFKIEVHPNSQFIDYAPASFRGSASSFVFKLVSPWQIRTPKGYSVMSVPVFFHFNNDISAMPGVTDTDYFHVVNQQVLYHGNGREVFIPRGTPLVQIIPFERKSYVIETSEYSEEFKDAMNVLDAEMTSQFSGQYRKMQRLHKKDS
jgi:hypothetical protein